MNLTPQGLSAELLSDDRRVQSLWRFLSQTDYFEKRPRILSVGPGPGDIEFRLIKEKACELSTVEPNAEFSENLRNLVSKNDLDSLLKQTFVGVFEDFQTSQKFDLLLSIHSWANMGYDETQVEKAFQFLESDGKLLLVIGTEKNITNQHYRLLHPDSEKSMSGEELAEWLVKLGLSVQKKIFFIEFETRLVLDGNTCASFLKDSISFWAQKPWDQIPKKIRDEIYQVHKEADKNGITQMENMLIEVKKKGEPRKPGRS